MHISKGTPVANSTKVWLTKSGACLVANNKSRIPEKDLKNIIKAITNNYFYIISEWKEYFGIDEVKFYC